jgi:hypothetical protein
MQHIIVEPGVSVKLRDLREPAVICDETGRAMGYYSPTGVPQSGGLQSPHSTAELLRRAREGGGRTLDEIIADLEGAA